MIVEPVNEYDAAEILLLIEEHFPYMEMEFEQLVKRINHPSFLFQKTMENDNLAGYAEWQIVDAQNKIVQLNGIVVKPWYQGKGHGNALLNEGEKWAKKKEMKLLTLIVAEANQNAQQLYREHGFAFSHMHPKRINGEKAQVWEKKI